MNPTKRDRQDAMIKGRSMRGKLRRFHSLILALALGLALVPLTGGARAQNNDEEENTYRMLKLFGEVLDRIRVSYVEELSDEQLIESAIRGMLAELDPHSSYLNEEELRETQVETKGAFGGLGIEVTLEDGLIKVVSPIDDTPAFRAGLQPGDFITHLDNVPVRGLTLSAAVGKMRGPENSEIVITVFRQGEEPFDVTLMREVIRIQSVKARRIGDVAYLRITRFNEQTTVGLRQAWKRLEDEVPDTSLIGVVLDLRNNPGGLLQEAISVSDAFLGQGEIVSTRGRQRRDSQRFNAHRRSLVLDLPLVVLVNEGSASASEIVAGALQDQRRAVILGARTFGKGTVQTIMPLDGNGALRLSTAQYFTPSGRSIQAKGIVPDIEVTAGRLEEAKQRRTSREADLIGVLDNKGVETPEEITPEISAEEKDSLGEDNQLSRAVDLVRGLALLKRG